MNNRRTKNAEESQKSEHDTIKINEVIARYLTDIDALEFAYPLAIGALDASFKTHVEGFVKHLAAHAEPKESPFSWMTLPLRRSL